MSLQVRFQSALELSVQMTSLARQQAWEQLADLQRQRAELLAAPTTEQAPSSQIAAQSIAEIIRQIQTCDEEIRAYVLPWMKDAAVLLQHLKTNTET